MLSSIGLSVFLGAGEPVDSIRRLFEGYFGIPAANPGQRTAWKFALPELTAGPLPGGLFVLAVLLLGVSVWVYHRDARRITRRQLLSFIALRCMSLLLVLLMISGVSLSVQKTSLPYLVVLVDTSASMGVIDQYRDQQLADQAQSLVQQCRLKDTSRLELAKSVLLDSRRMRLDELSSRYRLKVYSFDESIAPLMNEGGSGEEREAKDWEQSLRALRPLGGETRPAPCLERVLNEFRGATPAAIIVMTDGIASRSSSERLAAAAETARSQSVPLFPVGLGSSEPDIDLDLTDVLVDRLAILGDPLLFSIRVRCWGMNSHPVKAVLRKANQTEVLATVEQPGSTEPISLDLLTVPQEEGDQEYEVVILPAQGEANLENNTQRVTVSVRRTQIDVLLVERTPRWEFRHLKPLLERDEMVNLKTVLQDSDVDYVQEDRTALSGFPPQKSELDQFDVVILGDVDLSYMNPQSLDHLRQFVSEEGGGLIMVAGEKFNPVAYRGTPLEDLCPARLDGLTLPELDTSHGVGFRLQPTPEGLSQAFLRLEESSVSPSAIWSAMPELYWAWNVQEIKPGAIPLAVQGNKADSHNRLPVILWQRFGAGQVVFHATDELWQWRQGREDAVYGRYWGQVIRQLCRAKLLGAERTQNLTADRSVYSVGETIRLVTRRPAASSNTQQAPAAILERPGGERQRIVLSAAGAVDNEFQASLPAETVGSYRAWAETLDGSPPIEATRFRVEIPNRELKERAANHDDLKDSARLSHGKYYHWSQTSQLTSDLPAGQVIAETSAVLIPLWNRWELVAVLFVLLTLEWIMRKQSKLI